VTTESESPVSEQESEAAPASKDRYIRIDPDNLYGDFARALQERPDFAQAARTVIGTRAQREAAARIKELEAELENLTVGQQRQRFQSMDEDERAQALQNPNVAAEYARVMQRQAPDPVALKQSNAVNNAVESALDSLRDIGAPPERIKVWEAYLRDPAAPFDRTSATAFVQSVQRAVDMEVHTPAAERHAKYGYGKAPAPAVEQPESAVIAANPRLARGAPDVSRPDGGGRGRRYHTFTEASQIRQNEGPEAMPTRELAWAKRNLPYQ
jgi:hypothetical protein